MFRLVSLALLFALFSVPSFAQTAPDATEVPRDTSDATERPPVKLPPGKTITDAQGRVVENGGTNENGRLHVRCTGKIDRDANGNYTTTGEITDVTNPASQGSEGPINVNTNGKDTTINLDKNGTDPGGHIGANITGGNATVNVNGNFNDPSVGGTGNNVNMNGNHNSGSGNGAGSGGNVYMGGRGNSWAGNGGNWTTRN